MRHRAFACACALAACTPQQEAKAIHAGVDIGLCVLEHSTEPPERVAVLCGAENAQQVISIWAAAKHANARGFARLPADAGASGDGGQ